MREVSFRSWPEQYSHLLMGEIGLDDVLKLLVDLPISKEGLFQSIELITDTDTAVDFFSSNPEKYAIVEERVYDKLNKMLVKRAREPTVMVSFEVLKELRRMEQAGVPIDATKLHEEALKLSKVSVASMAMLIEQATRVQQTVTETDIKGTTFMFPEEFVELNAMIQAVRKDIKHANMLKPEKLSNYIFYDETGQSRLRTHWDIFGSLSGRIQSSDFNVQGLPKSIRQSCIQPPPGYSLICSDYVAEELMLIAILSEDTKLFDSVVKGEDLHRKIAARIFNKPEADITKEERSLAKSVDFAYLYGAGDSTLRGIISESWSGTEVTVKSVKNAICCVFTKVEVTIKNIEKQGYIELIDKSRISLEDIPKKHTYFNRMVQGSGAIILKRVIAEISKQLPDGARSCFLLHDELMVETPSSLTQVCVDVVTKVMTSVLRCYGYDIDLPISIEIKKGGVQYGSNV